MVMGKTELVANLFDTLVDDLLAQVNDLCQRIASLPLETRVEALNRIRERLHAVSPFREEPIDYVAWVPGDQVRPNSYNPNVVYRPEFKLLETSIDEDHYTQPIVAHYNGEGWEVVDGEHRQRVGTESAKIVKRLHGYIPITVTHTRTEAERMASTVRHNRARGVHKLDDMTDIVLSMLRADWTDDEIAKALGMDADEILRMKQVSGAAEAFSRPFYKRAWINDDGQSKVEAP
jgi:ParB-like chromosome segregation protein Spo0J